MKLEATSKIKQSLNKGLAALVCSTILLLPNQLWANPKNLIRSDKKPSYSTQIKSKQLPEDIFSFFMFENIGHQKYIGEERITDTLIKSLTKKVSGNKDIFSRSLIENLLENREVLIYSEPQKVNSSQGFYNKKIRDIQSIQSEIIARSLVDSIKKTFNQTHLGEDIRNLEDNIAKYFILELSKNKGKTARFYALGNLSVEEMKRKKDYKISVSSSLYPKPNSQKEDLSFGLKTNFLDTEMDMFYDVPEKGFGLNIRTGKLESLFGGKFYFYSRYCQDEKTFGFVISSKF